MQLTQSSDCEAVERFCHPSHTDSEACHQALTSKILILFGAPNEVVKPFLSLATRVDGASIRTAYDHKNYRSGGIVWINELKGGGWSQYQHMLLHEMGHTFGMKHDSCWVMTKDVADFTTGWNGLGDIGEIEATNWPYSFKKDDRLLFTDQKLAFDGSTTGYYPTRYFLPGLWDKFGFSEAGAFRLIGEVNDAHAQRIRLKLIFEEEKSGKKIEMSGSLEQKSYSFEFPLIPSLFTSWLQNFEPSKIFTKHRFFMNGWVSDNLQGALTWNQQEIPVTLERKKGMILSLYFLRSSDGRRLQQSVQILRA
ncbi:MAG: hypothetical protein IPK04_11425 [Bdellovibrionales bacterium]|nr:hypothetical protein [Bdellovibrionales bacterium]